MLSVKIAASRTNTYQKNQRSDKTHIIIIRVQNLRIGAEITGETDPSAWIPELYCFPIKLSVHYTVQGGKVFMKTMSYTESRARYAEVLDHVEDHREEVIITRAGHEPAVILSLSEYESLQETAYLMRSPANARRLMESISRLEAGLGSEHQLIEE